MTVDVEAKRAAAAARTKAWREANPVRAKESIAAARAKRPGYMTEYLKGYYERNKEIIKQRTRARKLALGEALKPINAEKAMRRLARKRQATPAWAEDAKIAAFYERAAELTRLTGIIHHVDHIVQLQSKLVCGLHVEHNLAVKTRAENQSKSNRWWPDMPDPPKEMRGTVREVLQ